MSKDEEQVMTQSEKWKDIQEILLRAECTDDREFKALTL